jgi:hypothetical protein
LVEAKELERSNLLTAPGVHPEESRTRRQFDDSIAVHVVAILRELRSFALLGRSWLHDEKNVDFGSMSVPRREPLCSRSRTGSFSRESPSQGPLQLTFRDSGRDEPPAV